MKNRSIFGIIILTTGVLFLLNADDCSAAPPKPKSDTTAERGELPEKLDPINKRTEAEQDRVDALALFAEARTLEQRDEFAAALRRYQRAFRYDPTSISTLRELIPLAFSLKREEEAVRYAAKLATLDASDPGLMQKIAMALTDQGEWEQALALYEKLLASGDLDEKSVQSVNLKLEVGRLFFLTGKTEKSAKLFTEVLSALENPDDYHLSSAQQKSLVGAKGERFELISMVMLRAKQIDRAAKAIEMFKTVSKNAPLNAYYNAQLAYHNKKYDDALTELNTYFAARETTVGIAAYNLLRDILNGAKRSDELLPMLEKQLAEQPGNDILNVMLGGEYQRAKKFDKAITRYENAISEKESRQAYVGLVESLQQLGNREKLLKTLGRIVSKTDSLDILNSSVSGLLADEEDPNKDDEKKSAEEDKPAAESKKEKRVLGDAKFNLELCKLALEKYDGSSPDDAPVLRACGMLALDAGDFKQAQALLDLAMHAKPGDKAKIFLVWGIELIRAEKYNDAAELFARAIAEKSLPESNTSFQLYQSSALSMAEKHDKALEVIQSALEKNGDDPHLAVRLPWTYYHAKKYREAIQEYKKILEKYDDNYSIDGVRKVLQEVRRHLSNIEVIRGHNAEAEEWLEQVLDEFPDDAGTMNDLGYLWADQNKRLERAHEMIKKAVAEEPDNLSFQDSLGWVLYRLGKYDDALVAQLKAANPPAKNNTDSKKTEQDTKEVDKPEVDGVVFDHLGDIYDKLQKPEKALESWRAAVKALEKSDEQGRIESVRKKVAAAEKNNAMLNRKR